MHLINTTKCCEFHSNVVHIGPTTLWLFWGLGVHSHVVHIGPTTRWLLRGWGGGGVIGIILIPGFSLNRPALIAQSIRLARNSEVLGSNPGRVGYLSSRVCMYSAPNCPNACSSLQCFLLSRYCHSLTHHQQWVVLQYIDDKHCL